MLSPVTDDTEQDWEGNLILTVKHQVHRRIVRILFSMMLISALVLSSAVQAFADEETLQGIPLNEETAAAFLEWPETAAW